MKDPGWKMNSELPGAWIRHSSGIPERFIEALDRAVDEGIVTMRGADRVLRLMWTLADLHERPLPNDEDLARALMLRNGGLNAN